MSRTTVCISAVIFGAGDCFTIYDVAFSLSPQIVLMVDIQLRGIFCVVVFESDITMPAPYHSSNF